MSSFIIKIIAVIAMLIDHIGFVFFPDVLWLRIIGRLAMPLFAFQVALGFQHTKDRNQYILRMLIFALFSQIPFNMLLSVGELSFKLNIGFTFLFALLALYSLENVKPIWGKILCLVPLVIAAYFLNYDYYLYGIALVIIFYYTQKQPVLLISLFLSATILYFAYRQNEVLLFTPLALIPILLYNGKKGPGFKYFFYLFYPLHMLIICGIFTQWTH